jgi:hypothetical protein
VITNKQLRANYLSPQMKSYFERKLAPLSPEEVQIRIEEALKFLNMAFWCNGDIPVSKEIDDVWHYWILQTIQYEELCAKLPGSVFLHHTSNDYALYEEPFAKGRKIGRREAVAALASYVMNYGPFTEDRVKYWPFATHMMAKLGWSIDELNAWLSSARTDAALVPEMVS